MTTFTATPFNSGEPPHIRLNLDTEDPDATFLTIYVTRDGEPIRTQPPVGADVSVQLDYDAPYGTAVTYNASGTLLPAVAADWTETWASTAAWTSSPAGWTVDGAGNVTSSTPNAALTRSASGAIQRASVKNARATRIEFLTSSNVVVASVTMSGGQVVVIGSSVNQVPGTGDYTVTFSGSEITVRGTNWVVTANYSGAPAKVRAVALGSSFQQSWEVAELLPASWRWIDAAPAASGDIYLQSSTQLRRFNSSGVEQIGSGFPMAYVGLEGVEPDPPNFYGATGSDPVEIEKWTTAGQQIGSGFPIQIDDSKSTNPQSRQMTLDSSGNFFVLHDDVSLGHDYQVRKFNSSGVETISGNFPINLNPYGATQTLRDVQVDSSGNIYVLHTVSGVTRIRKFDNLGAPIATGGFPVTVAATQFIVLSTGSLLTRGTDAKLHLYSSSGVEQIQTGALPISFSGRIPVSLSPTSDGGFILVSSDIADPSEDKNYYLTRYGTVTSRVGEISVTPEVNPEPFSLEDTATLSPGEAWLVHPSSPSLSVRIEDSGVSVTCDMCSPDDGTVYIDPESDNVTGYSSQRAIHQILGSNLPVVTTSGRRMAGVWTLVLNSCGLTGRDRLLRLLDDQQPVLLQIPTIWGYDLEPGWYSVGDLEERRLTDRNLKMPHRQLTLPMQPVARPSLETSFGHTWGDLLTEGNTWQTVLTTYGDWLNVLTGETL